MLWRRRYIKKSTFFFLMSHMLDKAQLIDLFDRLQTPSAGRELVLLARTQAPVRPVQSRGGNVITYLASPKMGTEIRTESRHIEFAGAIDKEYDAAVLEYYAQPCELKLELIDHTTGEIRNIRHFPDFLEIRADRITLEEWKSTAKLERLAERYGYRYVRGSDGRWYAPQIEEQLAELGIGYRIRSDDDIPRRRVENLLHLADYYHPAAEPCPLTELARLRHLLREEGTVFLADLLAPPLSFAADDIFKAIADHLVVADLDREQLSQPRRCRLYRDVTLREFTAAQSFEGKVPGQDKFVLDLVQGTQLHYEGQVLTISLLGEREVVCTQHSGSTLTLTRVWLDDAIEAGQVCAVSAHAPLMQDLSRHSQKDLEAALRRQALLNDSTTPGGVSDRTQRRWKARQNAAAANGGNEVLALVPNTAARGNRSDRLTREQVELMQHTIDTKWRSHEAANFKSCHRFLQDACAAAGVKAPSYPTLIEHIRAQETNRDLRTRHGKRMAYQLSDYVDVLYVDTPVHGSRPLQYVHIDHTQLDIELISGRTGKPLGRPWLSFAIDSWSRRIVAFYLTFDSPSYESTMMVLRDLVRRHQRMPQFVVVDNGPDFRSVAFEAFLKAMGVHLRLRPAGQPRHGAVLERVFGSVHTQYVHNLAGNTKATKNVRMVTGKHLPVNFAEWTLETMYFGIQHWATEFYDQQTHPALDCSPREMFQRGLQESGARAQRQIYFNQDFLIATCPPVDRTGLRKVHRQRGVKVNDMLFWSPEFRDPGIAGQMLPVRYDPWDASSAYVRVKDRWVQARCRNLLHLGQLTDFERRALTEEFIRKGGEHAGDEKSQQRLREFLQTFTPEGALAAALEREAENKALYNQLQLSSIHPVAPPAKTCLIEETVEERVTVTRTRSISDNPSATPPETTASDSLPDFDVF